MDKMDKTMGQEPVAWLVTYGGLTHVEYTQLPQVATPPRKEWVGLTGTEINHIFAANVGYPERMMKEVEALLREKNT